MKAIVKLNENVTIEVEEKNNDETLLTALALGAPRRKCSLCEGMDLVILANRSKDGFIFINNTCRGCGARSPLGHYKDGGYFWKDWEPKYEPTAAQDWDKEH